MVACEERPMSEAPRRTFASRVLDQVRARPRLTISTLVGLAVGLGGMAITGMKPSTQLIVGWDALCCAFLGSMLVTMLNHTPTDIRRRAALDDEGKGVILTLVLLAVAASTWAVAAELGIAKDAKGLMKVARIGLAFGTVVASWFMVQMIFALHYAHEYYGVDEDDGARDAGGLDFPGDKAPDYWDFLHFSIVIGATSQTADVSFTSKGLRRLGTVHSLVAFAYNTLIVALTINLTAGLF
jgi:uncharacterized membrane protein